MKNKPLKNMILVKFVQSRLMIRTLTFCLLFSQLSLLAQVEENRYAQAEKISTKLYKHIEASSFDQLQQYFSDKLAENLSTDQLAKSFKGLIQKDGRIVEALPFSTKITAEATYFKRGIEFEKNKYDLLFTLTDDLKLSSLRIALHEAVYNWKAPAYADLSKLTEEQIEVGKEKPLLGRLTKPIDGSISTVVIMVHGSGPNDLDATVGPNKIFKDLAYGLATNGIASIRYNKRSYDYGMEMAKNMVGISFKEVVIDDAVAAIQQAKELGATKVILLGHSLGGHLAPRIAAEASPTGVIILAGNSSPLQELLIPQFEYLLKNDSTTSINTFQLNMLKEQLKNLEDKKYDEKTVGPVLPLSLPGSFWLDLKGYQPPKMSKKQDWPYLILNGERDYQVPPLQAQNWKNGNKNEQSKTIIYPKLNHLFFGGEGICLPAEYQKEEHLDEQVLFDIIAWINGL